MKKVGIAADGVISPQVIDAIKPVDYDFMMMRIRELTAIAQGDAGMATAGSDRIKAVWTLIRLLFETIDTDFNGFVDKKELRSFYLKMGTPRERVEGLVSEYMGECAPRLLRDRNYPCILLPPRACVHACYLTMLHFFFAAHTKHAYAHPFSPLPHHSHSPSHST